MTIVIPLMGNYHSGKTTTTSLLYYHALIQGKKAATLQFEKGMYDNDVYMRNNIPHFTIPLEAAKGKDVLEKWLPKGYDVLILEGSYLHKPEWVIPWLFNHIFEDNEINEIIPFTEWDGEIEGNYQRAITKCPSALRTVKIPCVDTKFNVHNNDLFAHAELTPRMDLPKASDDYKVIAAGPIPYEWYEIFPNIIHYHNLPTFEKRLKGSSYDYAIIGPVNKKLKLNARSRELSSTSRKVICYDPYIFDQGHKMFWECVLDPDKELQDQVIHTVRNERLGTPLPEPEQDQWKYCYLQYSNPLWTFRIYEDVPILSHHPENEQIIQCNGWVMPQYLIKTEYVEVQ